MSYCSSTCRTKDAEKHAPLCSTFLANHTSFRPSQSHYRSIFFPVHTAEPCFVWLKYDGPPDQQEIDREHLRSYVTGIPSGGDATFDCFREGDRQLPDRITVRHDSNYLGNKQPYNQCVMALLGQAAGKHWRGSLLAQSYKYRINDGPDEWSAEYEPLIPTDLDTTSLAPILSFMNWRATSVDEYNLDPDANEATRKDTSPKKPSPKKPCPSKASSKNAKRKSVNKTPVKDEYDTESEVSWTESPSGGWTKSEPNIG
jgi:hypothetical protein